MQMNISVSQMTGHSPNMGSRIRISRTDHIASNLGASISGRIARLMN